MQPKCLPLREPGQSESDFRLSLVFMDTLNEQGCTDAVKMILFNFFKLVFGSYYKRDNSIILLIVYVKGKQYDYTQEGTYRLVHLLLVQR